MSIELTVNGIKELYCKKWVEYCIKDKDDPTKYENRCKFNNRCKYKHHDRPICIFFAKNGNCKFGNKCKNVHPKEFEKEVEKADYCISHFLHIKNRNFSDCKFGSNCKYAHGTSELTLPNHIKIFNNLLESGKLPFNEIQDCVRRCLYDNFELIANERKKAYTYFHVPDNFLEMLNLWRDLSVSYREWKRSCSKRVDMENKYEQGNLNISSLIDKSKSIQYIIETEGLTKKKYINSKSYHEIIGDYCYCRNYPDYLNKDEILNLPDLRPFDNEMKEQIVNYLIIRTNVCIKDYNSYVYGVHNKNDICIHGIKCNNGIHFEDITRDNFYSSQLNLNRLMGLENNDDINEIQSNHQQLYDRLQTTFDPDERVQIKKEIINNLKTTCVVESYGYLRLNTQEQNVPTENDFIYLVPEEELNDIKNREPKIEQLSQDEINSQSKIGSTLNNIFWTTYINQDIIRETFYAYSSFKLKKLKEKIIKCIDKKIKLFDNPYLEEGLKNIGTKYNLYDHINGIRKSFVRFELDDNKDDYYDFWGYYNSTRKVNDPRFYGNYKSLVNSELYDRYNRTGKTKTFGDWVTDTNLEVATFMVDNNVDYKTANLLLKSEIDYDDVSISQVNDNIGIVMDWIAYNGKNKGIKISELINNHDMHEWLTSNTQVSFDDFMTSKDEGFTFVSRNRNRLLYVTELSNNNFDKVKKNIGKYKQVINKHFINEWDNKLHSYYFTKIFNVRVKVPTSLNEALTFINVFKMVELSETNNKQAKKLEREILKVFPSGNIIDMANSNMSTSSISSNNDSDFSDNDSPIGLQSDNDSSSSNFSDSDSDDSSSDENEFENSDEERNEFDSDKIDDHLTGSYKKYIRESNYVYSLTEQEKYFVIIGPFYKKVDAKNILRLYKDDGHSNGKVNSYNTFHDIEISYKNIKQYKRGMEDITKLTNSMEGYKFHIDLA